MQAKPFLASKLALQAHSDRNTLRCVSTTSETLVVSTRANTKGGRLQVMATRADDDVAALVIDNGSGVCKAGFVDDDA